MDGSYFLSLNVQKKDVIRTDWVRPTDVKIAWKDLKYVQEIFTSEFLTKLQTVAEVSGMMLFNRIDQHDPQIAHTDVALVNDEIINVNCGLNIVFDDSTDIKSNMRWYSIKYPNREKQASFTSANTPYLNYHINELKLEAEQCIDDFVTLVRTDVPHTISSGNGCRTCISIRFKDSINWTDAVNRFNATFNQ